MGWRIGPGWLGLRIRRGGRVGVQVGPYWMRYYSPYTKGRGSHKQYFYGKLPDGQQCPHHHTRMDTAVECARAENRRRANGHYTWSRWL